MSEQAPASGHLSHCPVCGLPLQVRAREGAPELRYDFPAWDRLCKYRALGGPSMCLAGALTPADAVVEPVTPGCDAPADRRFV